MSPALEGQCALVTGASSGIGAATAIELARRGARVAINHRESGDLAEHVRAEAGAGWVVVQGDDSNEGDVGRIFAETTEKFGALDILATNAGVQFDPTLAELRVEDGRKVIGVNLTGQFLAAQAAAAIFRRQGVRGVSKAAGKIVCMGSVHERIPWPGRVNYAASKWELNVMMETLALELAPDRIRVVGVAPGAIRTAINRDVMDDEVQAARVRTPIHQCRIGESSDIAAPVAWLVSDEADYITGTTLSLDGGMTLYPGFADNG